MHGLSIRFHLETHHPSPKQGLHNLGPVSAVSCHLVSGAKFISLAGGFEGLQRFVTWPGWSGKPFLGILRGCSVLARKGQGLDGKEGTGRVGTVSSGSR